MNSFFLQPEWIVGFGAVLSRLVGLIMLLPTLPQMGAGLRMRGAFAVWLAWIIQMSSPAAVMGTGPVEIGVELVGGFLIGLVLGLAIQLAVAGFHFGGEVAGVNMGLGMAAVVDPSSGSRVNPLSRLLQWGAILLLFVSNAHLVILELLVRSLEWRPHYELWLWGPREAAISLIGNGIKLALPVVGCVTLIYLIFGVLARVAPQVQIFQIAYAITMVAGFLVLGAEMQALPDLTNAFIQQTLSRLTQLFH
ncbi:MAG: hypothetical protein CMH55_01525 [Myxococcales bacterium]|nr:hypothetical protein [Myxococcales bacterium]|tara:strand:- start:1795 stop:2544 length:750 start_codon:yes stop_codon:yes gene_type:complete